MADTNTYVRALQPDKKDLRKLKAKKKMFNPGIARSRWGNLINLIFLSCFGFVMILPMVFTVNNAFKPLNELFFFPPRFLVQNPTLNNFRDAGILVSQSFVPFSRYVFNTLFITVTATIAHIFLASLAAYVLEKRKFPGRNFISKIMVISLMFTPGVTGIPAYIVMANLKLVDNPLAIILPYTGATMGLYLMKQFMANSIPDALLESARIDGASELLLFRKIVMPLVKPAWLTMMLLSVQGLWGIAGSDVLFTETKKTLPYALSQILTGGIVRTGAAAAIGLIMMIPTILMFIISQTNVLETMASSGIKE